MESQCQRCFSLLQPDTKSRKSKKKYVPKHRLDRLLRRTNTSVLDALKGVYEYEGPSLGHLCDTCYVQLERDYRVYSNLPSPTSSLPTPTPDCEAKRKASTPLPARTPKNVKRVRTSPARPMSPRVLTLFSTPHSSHQSRLSFSVSPVLNTTQKSREPVGPSTAPVGTSMVPVGPSSLKLFNALRHGRYNTVLKIILDKKSKHVQTAFAAAVHRRVKLEMNSFTKESLPSFQQVMSTSSIQAFSWQTLVEAAQRKMPTLFAAICAGLGTNTSRPPKNNRWKVLEPRIGIIIAVSLFTKKRNKFKMVQSLCSLQLWRTGCSDKVFHCLNRLGICMSKSATRQLVDYLCCQVDVDLKSAKEAIEKGHEHTSARQAAISAGTSTIQGLSLLVSDDDEEFLPSMEALEKSLENSRCLSMLSDISENMSMLKLDTESPTEEEPQRYAFVWDNIQKLAHARDSSLSKGNNMHMWANAFVVLNRVQPEGLDDASQRLPASAIPLTAYLPSLEDEQETRERMETIVSRILVDHLKCFRDFGDVITWHIRHKFSEEMTTKSTIINYGILHENPSTRAGTMAIMLELQKHVPKRANGTYLTVPCHGDGLSVERMTDAKRSRAADSLSEDRLEGLEQTPQEFHHRGLMLQTIMNKQFKGGSIGERGTLAHLRNAFNHRNATTEVMTSFNAVENLIRFSTEAHVVYLAMKLMGMSKIDEMPSNMPDLTDQEAKHSFLHNLCGDIVRTVWLYPSPEQIAEVIEADDVGCDTWCFCCEDDVHGELVRCSNQGCPLGSWFHLICVGLEGKGVPEGDWWCSEECKEMGTSIYCVCRRVSEEETVECAAGVLCTLGRFIHISCAKKLQKSEDLQQEPWYCSSKCSKQKPDYQRNYTLTLVWNGLLDLVHRDAIREGDGLGMMSCWRLNMTRFWAGNHYKYLLIGHRLLAGLNGWLEPRLIEEITHNRTCNLIGSPGHNIPMDRVNEFLNNEFKETLRHAHGNYSDKTVHRAGRLVGSLATAIDEAFQVSLTGTDPTTSYRKRHNYQDDIEKFVEEMWEDELFTEHPGRVFKSFPQFQGPNTISRPQQLKKRFLKYNLNLDSFRRLH